MKLCRTKAVDAAIETLGADSASGTKYGDGWIEHDFLISLSELAQVPLAQLVKNTAVYFEPVSAPEKSPEYLDLMARLRAEKDEKEYQELIGNKEEATRIKPGSIEAKAVKEEVTTIFNIMISVVAVAWAIWKWTPYWSLQARTLTCLFGSILILVAEVVVYLGYRRRVSEAREAAQHIKEKRKIVETWTIEPEGDADAAAEKLPDAIEAGAGTVRKRK